MPPESLSPRDEPCAHQGFKGWLDGVPELKNWDFRAHIETHSKQMANAPADVQTPVPGQSNLPSCVALVSHGQKRWRQERRLTLASMRMTRKNPALIRAPNRAVCGIRVVTEHHRRGISSSLHKQIHRIEPRPPQV